MDGNETPSKIDLQFAEEKIIFLICDCSLDKKYSFYGLSREQATRFIKKLQFFEQMTWKQLAARPRDIGLTCEDSSSTSFALVHEQNTSARKFMEQYYFHFRIEPTGKFRVFGYQKGQYFCITHIDPAGKIHDH